MSVSTVIDWVASTPPAITASQARRLASRLYGVDARPTRLYAERDCNFRLDLTDGERVLLKVSNADTDRAQLEFQVRALRHAAARDSGLPIPRVIDDLQGQAISEWTAPDGERLAVRLMTWLQGVPCDPGPASPAGQVAAGQCLARLGRALFDCPADGAPHDLPWDLARLDALEPLTKVIDDAWLRQRCMDLLRRFREELAPRLATLPQQVIHNDLNPDNLLFMPGDPDRVAGIIDFGDMVRGALVSDLAVACAYQLSDGPDPVADLLPMVSGYCAVHPLAGTGLDLLPALVECRVLATLLIQGHRAVAGGRRWDEPGSTAGRAALQLRRLARVDPEQAVTRLNALCTDSAPPR